MIDRQTREIRYFLSGQAFADGLRITVGVLLPSLLLALNGKFETGLTLSVGALCVSIADSPGPVVHKRNGMLLCNLFIFVVAFVTGFARMSDFLLGVEILLFCFIFSMFTVYGNRGASVGTAALLVMILMMDKPLSPGEVLQHSMLVLGGGLWYMSLSLLFFRFRPYRPAQQALGECIHEVARFLRLKADLYRADTDLEEDFRKLVEQQILVNEKQDAARELLLRSRQMVKESTNTGRRLVLTFVDIVDLFEQIMSIHFDYATLREKAAKTGVLDDIADVISRMAAELDNIGIAIHSNSRYRKQNTLQKQLEQLKEKIDRAGGSQESNLVLKKILVNLRNLLQRLNDIGTYFDAGAKSSGLSSELDVTRFVSHQNINLKVFRDNLTLSSASFRHAARVAVVCLFGYLVTLAFPYGQHSNWVLLTIIVILKPAFSLTKRRNFERIIGTMTGGMIGVGILLLVQDMRVLLALLIFFMIGTYSFQRINYVVMVILMTPFILILFKFLGLWHLDVAKERVVDTLLGSGIALTASYLILPTWEAFQLEGFMKAILQANLRYLQLVADGFAQKKLNVENYKLARKEVYISSANLSSAFQRMLSEPKSIQRRSKDVYKFVVVNHILSSYIATVGSVLQERGEAPLPHPELMRPLRSALAVLHETTRKLDPALEVPKTGKATGEKALAPVAAPEDTLLKEQLEFIQKLTHDLAKITDDLLQEPQA